MTKPPPFCIIHLPVDVIREIFTQCMPQTGIPLGTGINLVQSKQRFFDGDSDSDSDTGSDSSDSDSGWGSGHKYPHRPRLESPKHPVLVANVCSAWRRLALATPLLWNHISVRPTAHTGGSAAKIFRLCLQRAKDAPRLLEVYDPDVVSRGQQDPEFTRLLLGAATLSQRITIVGSSRGEQGTAPLENIPSLSNLQTLELHFSYHPVGIPPLPKALRESAPMLQSLDLFNVAVHALETFQNDTLPWQQLTTLSIPVAFHNTACLSRILRWARNVSTLTVKNVDIRRQNRQRNRYTSIRTLTFRPLAPHIFPSIKTLTIFVHTNLDWLNNFTFPALSMESLNVGLRFPPRPQDPQTLLNFLIRSRCPLRSLLISVISGDNLQHVLAATGAGLKTLEVHHLVERSPARILGALQGYNTLERVDLAFIHQHPYTADALQTEGRKRETEEAMRECRAVQPTCVLNVAHRYECY